MKKLKLRIVKFNKLLVVEQLELEGEFKETDHVRVHGDLELFDGFIDLQENIDDRSVNCIEFDDNVERDEYTEKLIDWITEEQFGGIDKLGIGKECLVSNDEEKWYKHYLLAILPKNKLHRYITCPNPENGDWASYACIKPLNGCLKIDGEIHTWEIE